MERQEISVDWFCIFLYLILVIGGWLNIYSATVTDFDSSLFDLSHNYGKQFLWIACSLVLAFLIMILDTKFLEFTSYLLYAISILVLIAVLAFGTEVNGAKAWFEIGSFRIQPSEFAKITTAMALAKFMTRLNFSLDSTFNKLVCGFIILLPAAIILLQNDTGSALVFLAFFFVLYREGLPHFYLIALFYLGILSVLALVVNKYVMVGILVAIAIALWWFVFRRRYIALHLIGLVISTVIIFSIDIVVNRVLEPHQQKRIYSLFNPEADRKGAGYNIIQSKIAIGSGGFTGKGYLDGTQTKFDFVPEQDTDFIFCTIGEEQGWLGSTLLLVLFFIFLARLIYISENSKTKYARVYGYGVVSIFFCHIAINIGMTIGLAPVIGIPLPFFSYGGSSLFAFTILLFILLNNYANRTNIFSGKI